MTAVIAHLSIPAREPRTVAAMLAPIIDGKVYEFPVVPGGYIVIASDDSGLALEVLPERARQLPGSGEPDPAVQTLAMAAEPWAVQIPVDGPVPGPTAIHAAIITSLDIPEILSIAANAGWRAVQCERAGVFGVVEFWVENRFLIELLPAREARRYLAFMRPGGCEGLFGPALETSVRAA